MVCRSFRSLGPGKLQRQTRYFLADLEKEHPKIVDRSVAAATAVAAAKAQLGVETGPCYVATE